MKPWLCTHNGTFPDDLLALITLPHFRYLEALAQGGGAVGDVSYFVLRVLQGETGLARIVILHARISYSGTARTGLARIVILHAAWARYLDFDLRAALLATRLGLRAT